MKMLEYNQSDKEGFYNFLLSVGYNDNGANEIINRYENNRPDREDVYYYERYKGQQGI